MEQVIIREPFKGHAQTFIKNGVCMFTGQTVEQYLLANPDCRVITVDELDQLTEEHQIRNFVKDFEEITAEYWADMLETLPPMKWHNLNQEWNVFFFSEMMSGPYTSIFLKNRRTGKCYEGMNKVTLTDEQILELTKKIK